MIINCWESRRVAFGGERNSAFLPHNFGRNCVVYTGTHDNETTAGWYGNAGLGEQDHARRYVARDGSDIAWDMIRLAYASVADTAVAPLQDLMSLGNEARMNFPGKTGGWWTWRYRPEMLTEAMPGTRSSRVLMLSSTQSVSWRMFRPFGLPGSGRML